jgi:hypothetical protein
LIFHILSFFDFAFNSPPVVQIPTLRTCNATGCVDIQIDGKWEEFHTVYVGQISKEFFFAESDIYEYPGRFITAFNWNAHVETQQPQSGS